MYVKREFLILFNLALDDWRQFVINNAIEAFRTSNVTPENIETEENQRKNILNLVEKQLG